MTTHPLYPRGRASTVIGVAGTAALPSHELIAKLRSVRDMGDEAMTAVEEYDPDFSIKLSACRDEAAAERLLQDWLARRSEVLVRTQSCLREVWKAAHLPDSSSS